MTTLEIKKLNLVAQDDEEIDEEVKEPKEDEETGSDDDADENLEY